MSAKDKQVAVEKQNDRLRNTELTRDLPVFTPMVDIYEKDDAILVLCDMPGVDQDQVDITLENDVLTLTGVQDTSEPGKADLLHCGYTRGIFQRSFTLATEVDRSQITAHINQGVLKLKLPKAEEAKPRKITVSSGA